MQIPPHFANKVINILSILFCLLVIFLIYMEYGMTISLLSDMETMWDRSATLYFVPLAVLVITIVPFFRRKKIGWLLITIYLTYCMVFSIGLFIVAINRQPSDMTIAVIEFLFLRHYPPAMCLMSIALFGGILWIICQKNIRTVYKIDRKSMLYILGLTSILAGSIFFATREVYST